MIISVPFWWVMRLAQRETYVQLGRWWKVSGGYSPRVTPGFTGWLYAYPTGETVVEAAARAAKEGGYHEK